MSGDNKKEKEFFDHQIKLISDFFEGEDEFDKNLKEKHNHTSQLNILNKEWIEKWKEIVGYEQIKEKCKKYNDSKNNNKLKNELYDFFIKNNTKKKLEELGKMDFQNFKNDANVENGNNILFNETVNFIPIPSYHCAYLKKYIEDIKVSGTFIKGKCFLYNDEINDKNKIKKEKIKDKKVLILEKKEGNNKNEFNAVMITLDEKEDIKKFINNVKEKKFEDLLNNKNLKVEKREISQNKIKEVIKDQNDIKKEGVEENKGETNQENKGEAKQENKGEANQENKEETNQENKEETNQENKGETNQENKEETNQENKGEAKQENNESIGNQNNNEKDNKNIGEPNNIEKNKDKDNKIAQNNIEIDKDNKGDHNDNEKDKEKKVDQNKKEKEKEKENKVETNKNDKVEKKEEEKIEANNKKNENKEMKVDEKKKKELEEQKKKEEEKKRKELEEQKKKELEEQKKKEEEEKKRKELEEQKKKEEEKKKKELEEQEKKEEEKKRKELEEKKEKEEKEKKEKEEKEKKEKEEKEKKEKEEKEKKEKEEKEKKEKEEEEKKKKELEEKMRKEFEERRRKEEEEKKKKEEEDKKRKEEEEKKKKEEEDKKRKEEEERRRKEFEEAQKKKDEEEKKKIIEKEKKEKEDYINKGISEINEFNKKIAEMSSKKDLFLQQCSFIDKNWYNKFLQLSGCNNIKINKNENIEEKSKKNDDKINFNEIETLLLQNQNEIEVKPLDDIENLAFISTQFLENMNEFRKKYNKNENNMNNINGNNKEIMIKNDQAMLEINNNQICCFNLQEGNLNKQQNKKINKLPKDVGKKEFIEYIKDNKDQNLGVMINNFINERKTIDKDVSLGLDNVGATCYMNATLQCLAHIKKISDHIINYRRLNMISDKKKFKLTEAYSEVVNSIWFPEPGKKSFAPNRFKEVIGKMNSLFAPTAANDAKDLLIFLIEQMHNELNKTQEKNLALIMPDNMDPTNQQQVFQCFAQEFTKKYNSVFSTYCYGSNTSMTLCHGCNIAKYSFQCFSFIIFPLLEAKNHRNYLISCGSLPQMIFNQPLNIEDCFNYYQKIEFFTGDNQMYCNFCRQLQNASMCTQIYYAPLVLILVLNRGRGNLDFREKFVFWETINLFNYVQFKMPDNTYFLSGIITHLGESGEGGHFIAFCRMSKDSKWYCYNDSIVNESNFNEINNKGTPYILFYQKIKME